MKRHLISVIAVFILCSLAACQSAESEVVDSTPTAAEAAASTATATPAEPTASADAATDATEPNASGDAEQGEQIYISGVGGAPACVTCHSLLGTGFATGPSLRGVGERAGERVEGLSADEYIHQSILQPSAFLVPGYQNLMFPNYASFLSEQDITDLIAYLKTL